ncbi:MAG: TIGR03545 family protein [Bdellovibrionaceae bacterium]|nr:TIGR03545 family protein [Bdellovibrio sp.]
MTTEIMKTKKTQGPIRWNAIIPFLIICLLFWAYFYFFFDLHMRRALEWGGYKALGAEVNIGEFKSSFLKGNVQIKKIELTDSKEPDFNALELADVRFDVNWDALVRVKFVVEEMAVEGIQFKSKRSSRGKVAPPPPISNKPGFAQQLEDKALNKLEKDNKSNVLSDVSQFLKSGNFDDQIKNLEGQMASKKLLVDMNQKWTQKKTEWDAKIKTLPTGQELNTLKARFEKIKTKDFKTPQELQTSLQEIDSVLKEVDAKNRQVQDTKNQLDADLKSLDQDYKNIDSQIKKDIDTLKSRFKIPKIDAASFAKALFMDYLRPITEKVDRYKDLAEKYLPPKYARMVRGEKTAKSDNTIQPHARAYGITYEFPMTTGYPLFWIQKIKVSSVSNEQVDYGDFKGLITDVTSNQRQIGKPTVLDIKGEFKKMNVSGVAARAELNNTQEEPIVKFNFGVASYILKNLELMKSKDGQISIPTSNTSFDSSGEIIGFKHYDLKLKNQFNNVNFNVATADKTVNEILTQTLNAVKSFDLQASAKGELSDLAIEIQSSLGADLQRSFENLLKGKIEEANKQLQASINNEIGKLKSQLQSQTDALKNQAQGEINKVQAQVDAQKKLGEEKINTTKKDAENQAKGQVEKEAQKKIDELKKGLGF